MRAEQAELASRSPPLDDAVADMQEAMREASRIVLNGFELGTDAQLVRHPDRYMDERGAVMWRRVMALLEEADADSGGVVTLTTGCCSSNNTGVVLQIEDAA